MRYNDNKPVEVNEQTYNWLKKLEETQSWESCFYYISRQGLGFGFTFTDNNNIYRLDYDILADTLPKGTSYREFLLKALINGYKLNEPLYKVVDKNDLPLLTLHGSEVIKSFEITTYERLEEDTKKYYHLTEQQIKDYDERYWAFAVEVSEEDYE